MMNVTELRDPEQARLYILQGLWLQRVARPTGALVRPALEWVLEIASGGHPLPPSGFVADLGSVALGLDRGRSEAAVVSVPGWPPTLARSYEDHVLGRIYADWTFERATDALRRYTNRDQARGLAYIVRQFRERAGWGGVELSPAVVRNLLTIPGEELLTLSHESFNREGPLPLLMQQYQELISGARRVAEVLGPEDVIALEQRTALADMGQYVAHRQILQTCARLESRLPARPPRPQVGRKEVPTRVLDEDQYPVGGYTSIATKGSVESLLHSQLAYMEDTQPDLFDMKFVRDELFYYSRDENQFLRRRRTFVFVLAADLVLARFKDAALPVQRIVFVVAAALALIWRLTEWLTVDALKFELVFLTGSEATTTPLKHEQELLRLLLQDGIKRGVVILSALPDESALARHLDTEARTSQVHALMVSVGPVSVPSELAVLTTWTVNTPAPALVDGHGNAVPLDESDPVECWAEATATVLALWV